MHSFRIRRAGLAAAIAALAVPAAAHATTVSRVNSEGGVTILVSDTAGVADALRVTGGASGVAVFSTDDAALAAGDGCSLVNPTQVDCGPAANLLADLGGGNDTLIDEANLVGDLRGGAGADVLSVAGGTNTLDGGDGDDVLDLSGNSAAPDVARGGAGTDRATYEHRIIQPVSVTLDGVADDGAGTFPVRSRAPEDDNVLPDVEDVTGGTAGDHLVGSAGVNFLHGGPGPDLLEGGGGADTLLGDAGDDTEVGGPGSDTLGATRFAIQRFSSVNRGAVDPTEDTGADTFQAGDDLDVIRSADGIADKVIDCGGPSPVEVSGDQAAIDLPDPQPVGCETVQRAVKDQHPTVRVTGGALRVRGGRARPRVTCPKAAPGRACRGTLRLVAGGRALARARYRLSAGRSARVTLRLRRRAHGRASLRTAERDTHGRRETTVTRVTLR